MQPGLSEPALAERLNSMISKGPFQPLQFCNSVKSNASYFIMLAHDIRDGSGITCFFFVDVVLY